MTLPCKAPDHEVILDDWYCRYCWPTDSKACAVILRLGYVFTIGMYAGQSRGVFTTYQQYKAATPGIEDGVLSQMGYKTKGDV